MPPLIYRFEDYELDQERFELRRKGEVCKIEPQVFEVLCFLLARHGQFVGKEVLHDAIWQGRIVSDSTIASTIKAVRHAIGDDGTAQRLVRTIHGRGFSFEGPVQTLTQRSIDTASKAANVTQPQPDATQASHSVRTAIQLSVDMHLGELLHGNAPPDSSEARLLSQRALLRAPIEASGGQIDSMIGGGISARFDNAAVAVACAVKLQQLAVQERGPGAPAGDFLPRIGMCGIGADQALAAATAARLQCLAAPGEICVTRGVQLDVQNQPGFEHRRIEVNHSCAQQELGLSILQSSARVVDAAPGGIAQLLCGPVLQPREPSVVILPFQVLGADERAAELADGLRIDIQNALVKLSTVTLIAAGSASAFRSSSPEAAARSLGVRYVLHGVVQIVQTRARISLELIDTLSLQAIWTEQYEHRLEDSFAIQDDISRKVISALDVKLYSGEQGRTWQKVLTDPKIVRIFYRGVRLFFLMDREAMAEARRAFEAVANMRPESSIGATWVALCHWIDFIRHWREADSKPLAKRWAETAAILPDADGQAHTVLAHVLLLDRDFDAAMEAGQRALALRPGCANANGFYGNLLHYCGDQSGAIVHIRRGIRLQPVYPAFFAGMLATAHIVNGQPETAMAVGKEALRHKPGDVLARLALTGAAQLAGNPVLARLLAAEIMRLEESFSVARYCEDQPYLEPKAIQPLADAWRAAGLAA